MLKSIGELSVVFLSAAVIMFVGIAIRQLFLMYPLPLDLVRPAMAAVFVVLIILAYLYTWVFDSLRTHRLLFMVTTVFACTLLMAIGPNIFAYPHEFLPNRTLTTWDLRWAWHQFTFDWNWLRTANGYAQWPLFQRIDPNPYFSGAVWWSSLGLLLSVPAGIAFVWSLERTAKEIRLTRSHKGTNRYRSSETVFGDAQWGDWSRIRHQVEDPNGIVLGEDYDPRKNAKVFDPKKPKTWGHGGRSKLITMATEFNGGHTLVFSGTGGGKTQAIVIPTALTYRRPIIVLDTADEIHNTVSKARANMGFKSRVIQPGQGLNIFKLLKPYLDNEEKVFLTLAQGLVAPTKENTSDGGRYFTDEAAILAAGLLKHLYLSGESDIFGTFAKIIAKSEKKLKDTFESILEDYEDGEMVHNFLGTYTEMESRTFASLQATTRQALIWASLNKFGDILSDEPKDAEDPLAEDTDIYIKISTSDLRSFPTIVRQIISTIAFIAEEEKGIGERLMIIDEAYQVGKLKQLEIIRDTMRKRGLHLLQIFQSVGQLQELYGDAGLRSWNSSVAARVFTNTEDAVEQKQISEAIGSYTANIESESTSSSTRGLVIGTPGSSRSENRGLQGVPLLRPEQVRTLPNDAQILFFKGQYPIVCGKAFSWRRREWQEHTPYKVKGEIRKLPR